MATAATKAKPRRARYVAGIQMPRNVDGRTLAARAFRKRVREYANMIGEDNLTPLDRLAIRTSSQLPQPILLCEA